MYLLSGITLNGCIQFMSDLMISFLYGAHGHRKGSCRSTYKTVASFGSRCFVNAVAIAAAFHKFIALKLKCTQSAAAAARLLFCIRRQFFFVGTTFALAVFKSLLLLSVFFVCRIRKSLLAFPICAGCGLILAALWFSG